MSNDTINIKESIQAPLPWQRPQWGQLWGAYGRGQLAHAYLLGGEQGLGKEQFARDFAAAVLCDSPQQEQACGSCGSCRSGGKEFHPDIRTVAVNVKEDKKVIIVEQIRDLTDFLQQTSHGGKWKMALIVEAHRMNLSAANALLKTLEEPTSATTLLLVSDLPGRLLPTVRSRCQKVSFTAPDFASGLQWLEARLSGQPCSELLALARGRPLHALQLAANEGLVEWQQFTEHLQGLWQGRAGVAAACKGMDGLGIDTVLDYLLGISAMLTRAVLDVTRQAGMEPYRIDRLQSLQGMLPEAEDARIKIARRLMRFGQMVEQAVRQVRSGANPNTQLILESLLRRWQLLLT